MLIIDETTSRSDLEVAALMADLNLTAVAAASDDELRNMLMEWIESGDECGGCA